MSPKSIGFHLLITEASQTKNENLPPVLALTVSRSICALSKLETADKFVLWDVPTQIQGTLTTGPANSSGIDRDNRTEKGMQTLSVAFSSFSVESSPSF